MTTGIRVRLRILGSFGAFPTLDGAPAIQIASPRHRALLAYLALQPCRSEARERLAGLLWEDGSDSQARKRFRQSLLRLRREFESAGIQALVGNHDRLSLDSDTVQVDACEFLQLAGREGDSDLDAAAELYRGPLLEGVQLDNAVFDDWLRRERFRLRTVAAQVFEKCAYARERRGDADGAVEAAGQLVALDTSDETTQRLLIGLLARLRGKSAALSHAENLRDYIRKEFGSNLEPETLRLIADIKNDQSASRVILAEAAASSVLVGSVPPQAEQPAAFSPRPVRASSWHWLAGAIPALAAGVAAVLVYAHASRPAAQPQDAAWQLPATTRPAAAVSQAIAGRGVSALVVLPFKAPADSTTAARMADFLTNDLINDLSRVPSLRVIAKSAGLKFSKEELDVAALGHQLGVQYVIEGEVRVADGSMRVNIALIDTRTRLQVWTARYERDQAERFKVQGEIAQALARQLHVGIMEHRGRAARNNPDTNSLLARGWASLNRFAFFRGGNDAGDLFEQVLAIDPGNLSALTGLGAFKAVAYNTRQGATHPDALLQDSERLLKRAQAIDPKASLPLYFLGRLAMWRGQRDEALTYFTKAIEINPSAAPAYGSIGYVLLHTEHLKEALENLLYAIRLSPEDHYMGLWSAHVGRIYLELGDLDAAEKWLAQSVDLMPKSVLNRAALAAYHSYRGNDAAAAAQIVEMKKLESSGPLDDLIGRFTVLCQAETDRPKHLIAGLRKAMASN